MMRSFLQVIADMWLAYRHATGKWPPKSGTEIIVPKGVTHVFITGCGPCGGGGNGGPPRDGAAP